MVSQLAFVKHCAKSQKSYTMPMAFISDSIHPWALADVIYCIHMTWHKMFYLDLLHITFFAVDNVHHYCIESPFLVLTRAVISPQSQLGDISQAFDPRVRMQCPYLLCLRPLHAIMTAVSKLLYTSWELVSLNQTRLDVNVHGLDVYIHVNNTTFWISSDSLRSLAIMGSHLSFMQSALVLLYAALWSKCPFEVPVRHVFIASIIFSVLYVRLAYLTFFVSRIEILIPLKTL